MCGDRLRIGAAAGTTRQGNVLLLSLFALSTIMLGGLTVGTLVLRELRAARVTDAAQGALAAAESGNERALYEIRKLGRGPRELAAVESLPNGAVYRREIVQEPAPIFTTIPQDTVYELVLYDPAATPPAGGVASLRISWDASCGAMSVLELTGVSFTPGTGWSPDLAAFRYSHPGPVTYALADPGSQGTRLRIRAERCDATDVRIDAFDAGGAPAAFPDRVAIVSTGEYRGTRQASQVVAPTVTTLSGLFDFVLFSECEITKGGAAPVCP